MPRIFWPILAAMLAFWMAMNFWSAPRIEEAAGGLRLLDMRFTGYSHSDVRAFVAALGDDGAALYLEVQFWLDMVFPPLLGAVLFFVYRWLFPGIPAFAIAAISLTYVSADILENFAVATAVRAGAEGLTAEMAATANRWTTIKWGLAFIGLAMLITGIGLRLHRRWSTG